MAGSAGARPVRVDSAAAWDVDPAGGPDADREADRVAGQEAAWEDDPAAASGAAREADPVVDQGEGPVADREAAWEDDPAAASGAGLTEAPGAGLTEAPGDAPVDRSAGCRVESRARRDGVRSRYGQVRRYPGCCRRGNSRTDLQ
ncbi:Glucosyltransferase [Rhodococcus sp. AW25M09]|nr:Glucosyltransferase [Rhodococcus sp. AW25M09]